MSYVANPTAHTASVFGPAAAPIVWTNLDISAVTGAQTVWALIKIETQGAGVDPRIAVRPDGDADEYFAGNGNPHGSTRAFITTANESMLLAVKTNNLGVIEWRSSVATNVEVFVLGHVVISNDSTNVYTGTLPTSFTEQDISTIIGRREMLTVMKWHRTGGTQNNFALRPGDDADDYLVTTPEVGGANMDGNDAINIYSNVVVKTDALGTFDFSAESVAPAGVFDMACYAPLEVPAAGDEVVFGPANPPVAWTVLSLSGAGVPAAKCLVLLKIHHEAALGLRVLAVRDADDAGNYLTTKVAQMKGCACCELENDQTTILMCPTNGNGDIDWIADNGGVNIDIEVLGWMEPPAGPTATNYRPEDETFVSTGAIGATITSDDPIDTTSIGLTVTDARGRVTPIITAGVVQSPFTGTIVSTAPGTREVEINCFDPDETIASGELHLFTLTATDASGSSL